MTDGASYYNLYVRAPEGNGYTTPQAMKRIDEHLTESTPASFRVPPHRNGLPEQEADGSFEVRVYDGSAVRLVVSILTKHYGLEVIRGVKFDSQHPEGQEVPVEELE